MLLAGADVSERKRQDEEVRASRKRIVDATDAARRRLERNLHDGAQQRLAALSLSLRLAESRLETDVVEAAEILTRAREELARPSRSCASSRAACTRTSSPTAASARRSRRS